MATTEDFYDGGNTSYPISIEYIKATDIKVEIDGTPLTYNTNPTSGQYKVVGTTVTLGAAATAGTGNVHIYRVTDLDTAAAVFAAGSSIRAQDLNACHDMVRFASQEQHQKIKTVDIQDSVITTEKIKDGTLVDADISGSAAIAQSKIATGNLPSGITVNSANIVDQSIVNDDISNSANIDGSKLADDTVSLNKLGAGTLPNDIVVTRNNIENGTIQDADIETGTLDNRYYTETELDNGQLDNQYYTETELNNGQLDNRYFTETELSNGALDTRYYTESQLDGGQLNNLYFTESELTGGTLDGRYYTETELDAGQLDNRYYTETEAEALFLRQDSSETIASGVSWSSNDSKVATTAAIDARIIDLLDDVGGFVPLANETSFPTANPDINNGNGTVVSVKAVSTNLTPSSGTVTIANGAGTGNTVTITGVTGVIPQGFGMILETTSTLHTYAFHRLQAKATEVNTVASNITQVVACGNNLADIYNFADLYQISTTAPTQRADGTSLVTGDLWFDSSSNQVMMVYDGSSGDGFSPITPDQSTITAINTVAGHVTYQEDLGLITDAVNTGSGNNSINTVGANIAAVNTVAADLNETTSEIDTVATNITNVNNVGNSISNVNAVAGNQTNIDAVKNNATNINAVAANNANITAVANNETNINAVKNNETNINAVKNNSTNINAAVANASNINSAVSNASNINTVAGISSEVTTVANNTSNINAAVANQSNINSAVSNATNINTVATNVADVNNFVDRYQISSSAPTQRSDGTSLQNGDLWFNNSSQAMESYDGSAGDGYTPIQPSATVIQNIANVTGFVTFVEDNGLITDAINTGTGNNSINTVGADITNVNTVAGSIANVNTTAGDISNVNTVAGSIANVNTVGNAIADVNRYADEYVIQSGTPSSPSEGDLWYNSTANVLNYYNSSSWVAIAPGIAGVINDANPALANHLDCNDKNLTEVATISGNNLQLDFGTL